MTVQSTSMAAYASLLPHMGMRQMEVYEALWKKGGMTNTEIAEFLGRPINVITPRCNELRKLNLVQEGPKRPCGVTGKNAIEWQIIKQTLF